jgi:hypothetical protein
MRKGSQCNHALKKSEEPSERGAIIENGGLNSEKAQHQVRFQKVDLPKKVDTRPETKTQYPLPNVQPAIKDSIVMQSIAESDLILAGFLSLFLKSIFLLRSLPQAADFRKYLRSAYGFNA